MRVRGRDYWAVYWDAEAQCAAWIDQTELPFRWAVRRTRDPERVVRAIQRMEVRGAPTIGAAAALGLALAWMHARDDWEGWCRRFAAARPTAVNLMHAVAFMQAQSPHFARAEDAVEAAVAWARAEVARHRRLGEQLAARLARGRRRILTHCNTGWLAAVDWGTALAGVYALHRAGEQPFVWVNETRPRWQGGRLTAWELAEEGVRHCIQVDSASAFRMQRGEVDAVVVGADRIAANGDVANKIGTLMLAALARAYGVPFFVAAPTTTLDAKTPTGEAIPIEERAPEEIICADGVDASGAPARVRVLCDAPASNPAFDVTPYAWITEIITEDGPWRPRCS